MSTRVFAYAATSALLAVLLAACGAGAHNKADETFVRQMIPHHEQAVEMAKEAASHDAGPKVRALAKKIEKAQTSEIAEMKDWLDDWDVKEIDTSHGHVPMTMDAGDMKRLGELKGSDFDQFFVTLMIQHHHGALDMAKTELKDGSNGDAQDLARSIQKTQAAEIKTMQGMLTGP